jgi:hypothetical protein
MTFSSDVASIAIPQDHVAARLSIPPLQMIEITAFLAAPLLSRQKRHATAVYPPFSIRLRKDGRFGAAQRGQCGRPRYGLNPDVKT